MSSVAVGNEPFNSSADIIRSSGVTIWKENKSEGDSLYILDPDGYKLEIHSGDIQSRLAALKEQPYEGLELHE